MKTRELGVLAAAGRSPRAGVADGAPGASGTPGASARTSTGDPPVYPKRTHRTLRFPSSDPGPTGPRQSPPGRVHRLRPPTHCPIPARACGGLRTADSRALGEQRPRSESVVSEKLLWPLVCTLRSHPNSLRSAPFSPTHTVGTLHALVI